MLSATILLSALRVKWAQHTKYVLHAYAQRKDPDQPEYLCSVIRVFVCPSGFCNTQSFCKVTLKQALFKYLLVLKVQIKICTDDIVFLENRSWYFMWIVCLADNSLEMSRHKKNKWLWATTLTWAQVGERPFLQPSKFYFTVFIFAHYLYVPTIPPFRHLIS